MGDEGAFLSRLARRMTYVGLFASSFLVARIGSFTVGDLLLIAAAALTALEPGRARIAPLTRWAPAVSLLIVLGGLLAAFRSADPAGDLVTILRVIFLVTVLPWQLRSLMRNRSQLKRALNWWLAGTALSAAGTLIQYSFGAGSIPTSQVTNAGRFSGFTQSVSDIGGIACLGVVVAIAGLSRKSGRGLRLGALLAIGLSLVGLVLSGSVSGFIAAAIGVIYLLIRGNIRPARAIFLGLLVFAALFFALRVQEGSSAALDPVERLLQAVGLTGDSDTLNTTASRLQTIQAGVQGIVAHPVVGAGLDGSSSAVVGVLGVHNLLVAAAYGGGAFLFVALLLPIVSAWRRLWVRRPIPQYLMQANAGFVTALVFAMTAPSFYNRYFWIPVAMAYVAAVVKRDAPELASDLSTDELQRPSVLVHRGVR